MCQGLRPLSDRGSSGAGLPSTVVRIQYSTVVSHVIVTLQTLTQSHTAGTTTLTDTGPATQPGYSCKHATQHSSEWSLSADCCHALGLTTTDHSPMPPSPMRLSRAKTTTREIRKRKAKCVELEFLIYEAKYGWCPVQNDKIKTFQRESTIHT